MANDFMILELGTDLADSKKFKKIMLSRHGGRDLTPRCTYPNTKSGDLTHLNQVPQSAWKDKRIQKWMKDFVSASPTILYLSSHHYGNFFSEYLWNSKDFGVKATQTGLKYGDQTTLLLQGKEAQGISYKKNLVLIIVDGCNIVSSTGSSSGKIFQKLFSFKGNKPVILGFTGKSPGRGTAPLHKAFLESLTKSEFTGSLKTGSNKQNHFVNRWLNAGKKWKHVAKRRLVAIDNKGKVFDYSGKEFMGTMDRILR